MKSAPGLNLRTFVTLALCATILAACDQGQRFSSLKSTARSAQSPDSDDPLPPPADCVANDAPKVEGDLYVEVGRPATLTYRIERNPLWVIWLPSGEQAFQGETISVTIHQEGQYNGVAWGNNNCGQRVEHEFTIVVTPALGLPAIAINNGAFSTRSNTVNLDLSAQNAQEMYITKDPTCSTGGTWEPYSPSKSWTLPAESADARVYATFRTNANVSTCVSDGILYDITPPVLKFEKVPAAISYLRSAHFEFSVSDNTNVTQGLECAQDDKNNYQSCSLTHDLSGLTYDQYTMYIRASDLAGNVSEDSYTWTIENTPPMVRLLTTPPAVSNSRDAEFTFDGSDDFGSITFECQMGVAPYTPCSSPHNLSGLQNKSYTFSVRARDGYGLYSAPASYTWRVDVEEVPPPAPVPPVVTLTQTPTAITSDTVATFGFSATHSGVGIRQFICQLDNDTPTECRSPNEYRNLAVGIHGFSVYAVDNENLQSNTATYKWEVLKIRVPLTDNFTIDTSGRKLDIVIVDDNSPSMAEEQKKMAARFSTFLEHLKGLDWQLGIITTDAGNGRKPYQDGRLVPFVGAPAGTFAINAATKDLQKVFAATVVRKEWGNDTEEGIRSIFKMLQRPENRFMVRDQSHLATIIISDEDEHSNGKKLKDYNTPENLINTFAQLFGKTNTYSNHSIVLMPGYNAKTCPQVGSHQYGATYAMLSKLTGGIIGDICAPDYGDILKNIGDDARNKTFTAVLKCEPVGNVDVALVPQPTTPIQSTIVGKQLTLSPYPPVGTQVAVTYYCE